MRYRVLITQDIVVEDKYLKVGEEAFISSPSILEKIKDSVRVLEAIQDVEPEDREKKVKVKEK
ncbi:MAG: hypothetical protein ABDH28_06560 [Brevinematia bacterium]